ncbi:MAG: HAMP domain-containing histidine kinase [Betaproteobacteria bacterium]|nr:HAMP domain-containing histidine kinase [Betaproteobacteria bacterium]
MRRLYLRVYLAVIISLAVFAIVAGMLWRQLDDPGPQGFAFEVAGTLAVNALPPGADQQAALERLARNLRADIALYSRDRVLLASVGEPLPAPRAGRTHSGWLRRIDGPPAWAVRLPDERWLVARVPRDRRHPAYGLFLTLALIALAVGVGMYPVVRRLTKRLERLQAGVESLGAGELTARVPVEGRDEVAQLAGSFNAAAARIEKLVEGHKGLLAHASHELRTPLARIRMGLELVKGEVDAARRAALLRDIAELDAMIDEILLASRLDALPRLETVEEVDLLALAAEECARYDGVTLAGEPATLRGDPRLLRRLLRNLLENAARHGRPPVQVAITRSAQAIEIAVSDAGAGVPEGERERIFEPFMRGAGTTQGTGLGLSLVRQIARRHGGEARYADGFRVTLAPAPPAR